MTERMLTVGVLLALAASAHGQANALKDLWQQRLPEPATRVWRSGFR